MQTDRVRQKVALVVSSPMTARFFLQDQIKELALRYDLTVIANYRDRSELGALPKAMCTKSVDIRRKVEPLADLRALFALWRIFRGSQFDIVHSVTPKAGLLSMLAGFAARIPHRLHTFTGQVWATRRGLGRSVLRFLDTLIFRLSTLCFVDSRSQRDFLLREGVVTEQRSRVLADGSISGVDMQRFVLSTDARQRIRASLGIADEAYVILYLGRLNRDKGILDLAQAVAGMPQGTVKTVLLLVGPDEGGIRRLIEQMPSHDRNPILFVGFTDRPEDYMNAADVFCLPSYREGFGSVIVEAAYSM